MSDYILIDGTLYHHGIKGQKWGQRNYQNPDGSYTAKGQAENNGHGRYSSVNNIKQKVTNKWNGLTDKQKKYIKIGLAVAATSLAVYGGYRIYQNSFQLQAYKKLGKKNVDFIKNSGKFDYLSGDNIGSSINSNNSNIVNRAIDAFDEKEAKIFDPEQLRKLSDDEMRSLQIYTTSWYHDINNILRKENLPLQNDEKIVRGIIDNLKTAFSKVSLSSDVNVSRGIDAETTKNKLLNPEIYSELMRIKQEKGDYLSGSNILEDLKGYMNMDPGVMSTSYNTKGKVIESYSGKNGVIVDVVAKKGLHGIVMRPFSEAPHEFEVAFAPDSAFQFTGEYSIINGIIHLTAEIIQ